MSKAIYNIRMGIRDKSSQANPFNTPEKKKKNHITFVTFFKHFYSKKTTKKKLKCHMLTLKLINKYHQHSITPGKRWKIEMHFVIAKCNGENLGITSKNFWNSHKN